MPKASDSFYSTIPIADNFGDLTDRGSYVPLPEDWSLVVADITDSTGAIEAGRYKAVNSVGVSVIAACTNAVEPIRIPWVFGGDGATVCFPSRFAAEVRQALSATRAMAAQSFGLDLRVGLVPMSFVRSAGRDVWITRHRVSPHYLQCALYGGGVEYAERELKQGHLPDEYLVEADPDAAADYSGLECRWRQVPSPKEETVTVIIRVAGTGDTALERYRAVIERITAIYGEADRCRPVDLRGLRLALSSKDLRNESLVRTWGAAPVVRMWYALRMRVAILITWVLLKLGLQMGRTNLALYQRQLIDNTDFRKFDGSLRLVVAGDPSQRRALTNYLEERAGRGELTFGMHISDSALMTCLIRDRSAEHFHFVDGAGGGYAEAARAMKAVPS